MGPRTYNLHTGKEVDHLDLTIRREKQICRLDVTVNHPSLMGFVQCQTGFTGHAHGLSPIEDLSRVQRIAKAAPFEQLHDTEHSAIRCSAKIVHADQAMVMQPRQSPRLTPKPSHKVS